MVAINLKSACLSLVLALPSAAGFFAPASWPARGASPRIAGLTLYEGNIESLKVDELKSQLKQRGLKVSGLKSQLVVRLKTAIEAPSNSGSVEREGAAAGRADRPVYDGGDGGRYSDAPREQRGDGAGRYSGRGEGGYGRGRGRGGAYGSSSPYGRGGGSPYGRGGGRSIRSGSRTNANARPGDWSCPKCRANNFASRVECFRCGAPNPAGGGGGRDEWQGLDGADDFDASLDEDEAAFRKAFGEAKSSGIEFDKYADIPVEVELPRRLDALPEEMQPVATFAELRCGRVLGRNLNFAGFSTPTPVQAHSVPMAIGGQDVISVAQTGSGKTLAFMLPILRTPLAAAPRRRRLASMLALFRAAAAATLARPPPPPLLPLPPSPSLSLSLPLSFAPLASTRHRPHPRAGLGRRHPGLPRPQPRRARGRACPRARPHARARAADP